MSKIWLATSFANRKLPGADPFAKDSTQNLKAKCHSFLSKEALACKYPFVKDHQAAELKKSLAW